MARPRLSDDPFRFWCRSGVYYVMFDDRPGHWVSSGTTEIRAATRWAKRALLEEGEARKPKTFSAFTAGFFDPEKSPYLRRLAEKGTLPGAPWLRIQGRLLARYLEPAFGRFLLSSISRRRIDDFLLAVTSPKGAALSHQSKNHLLSTLKTIFAHARDEGLVDVDPTAGLGRFRDDWVSTDILTPPEMTRLFPPDPEALYAIWGERLWAVFFLVLRDGGLRPGEVRALQWRDWYRSHQALIASSSIEDGTGRRKGIKTSKKGAQYKPVVLSDRTQGELLQWEAGSRFTAPEDYLFCFERGQPVGRRTVGTRFTAALRAAGIEAAGRKLVPYSLRHGTITRIRALLDLAVAQTLGGHTTEETSERYYHPDAEAILAPLAQYRSALNAVWTDHDNGAESGN
jgi:integrase